MRKWREERAQDECMICLTPPCSISALCCGAGYHLSCLYEWISQNSTCPQCRAPLDQDAAPAGGGPDPSPPSSSPVSSIIGLTRPLPRASPFLPPNNRNNPFGVNGPFGVNRAPRVRQLSEGQLLSELENQLDELRQLQPRLNPFANPFTESENKLMISPFNDIKLGPVIDTYTDTDTVTDTNTNTYTDTDTNTNTERIQFNNPFDPRIPPVRSLPRPTLPPAAPVTQPLRFRCSACKLVHDRANFSGNQMAKQQRRRCKHCVRMNFR